MRGSEQVYSPQNFTCYSTKSYVVGTQMNRLTEMISLSTHNIGFDCQIRILDHETCPLSRALHACPVTSSLVKNTSYISKFAW